MKICLFGVPGFALGRHNIKDPRLDEADKLVEAEKKTYAQVDVVEEKEMLTADAILTRRAALSDLLMKDLDAVETRLGRDPAEAEKAVLQKLADALMSEKPLSSVGLTAGALPIPTPVTLIDAEREHIISALTATGWVVGGSRGAAARLGMKRSTLQKKMQKLGVTRPV